MSTRKVGVSELTSLCHHATWLDRIGSLVLAAYEPDPESVHQLDSKGDAIDKGSQESVVSHGNSKGPRYLAVVTLLCHYCYSYHINTLPYLYDYRTRRTSLVHSPAHPRSRFCLYSPVQA